MGALEGGEGGDELILDVREVISVEIRAGWPLSLKEKG